MSCDSNTCMTTERAYISYSRRSRMGCNWGSICNSVENRVYVLICPVLGPMKWIPQVAGRRCRFQYSSVRRRNACSDSTWLMTLETVTPGHGELVTTIINPPGWVYSDR